MLVRWPVQSVSCMLPQAPAISVARSLQAVGKACPSLVGRHKGMRDQNATRDVTALLVKLGMSMNVQRETLAPSQQSIGLLQTYVLGEIATDLPCLSLPKSAVFRPRSEIPGLHDWRCRCHWNPHCFTKLMDKSAIDWVSLALGRWLSLWPTPATGHFLAFLWVLPSWPWNLQSTWPDPIQINFTSSGSWRWRQVFEERQFYGLHHRKYFRKWSGQQKERHNLQLLSRPSTWTLWEHWGQFCLWETTCWLVARGVGTACQWFWERISVQVFALWNVIFALQERQRPFERSVWHGRTGFVAVAWSWLVCIVNGHQFFAATIGCKGDLKFHHQIGNLCRSYYNVGTKSEHAICSLCLAGRHGFDFEDCRDDPPWMRTMFSEKPWPEGSTPSLAQIPFQAGAPESIFRLDLFHCFKCGWGRDLTGSSVVMMAQLGYFDSESDSKFNLPARLERAHGWFHLWCKAHQKSAALHSFSKALLNYKNKNSFAWFNVKGSDNTLLTLWLLHAIKLSVEQGGRGYPRFESALLETLESAKVVFEILHSHSLWLSRVCAQRVQHHLAVVVRGYKVLAREAKRLNVVSYGLKPKLHALDHIGKDFQKQLKDKAPLVLNPLAWSCEANESVVGHVSRLARRVDSRTCGTRVFDRICIKVKGLLSKYGKFKTRRTHGSRKSRPWKWWIGKRLQHRCLQHQRVKGYQGDWTIWLFFDRTGHFLFDMVEFDLITRNWAEIITKNNWSIISHHWVSRYTWFLLRTKILKQILRYITKYIYTQYALLLCKQRSWNVNN